ncbi:hypothetical protein T11_4187 [Trichinella zimbabwensis]|uniref:Uncharacterized protein n=1 Tax=Trichinella zimbabwensis TaxID=268475 RepID=A0A0V1HWU3_9BILA|nr:hypothetical protein T11_4187 [Trichinella zimbabwensis]
MFTHEYFIIELLYGRYIYVNPCGNAILINRGERDQEIRKDGLQLMDSANGIDNGVVKLRR